MITRAVVPLFILVLAAGCATVPMPPSPAQLFDDRAFGPATSPVSAGDVFALSDEMKLYLNTVILEQISRKGSSQQGLFDALYDKGQLKLEYDAVMTRNAAQAFAARSGNCLSLVIMTAAFAKALNLPVRYQSAVVDEDWSRGGDLQFLIGHVNLTLATARSGIWLRGNHDDDLTIDFLAPHEVRGLHTKAIREETVVAMYMNNRAAELMLQGKLNDAYAWARAAVTQDPGFMSSYNTLGVIYRRQGSLQNAEQVFSYALDREPRNTRVMSNLVAVLKAQGRGGEAQVLAAKLAALEPNPAFSYYDEGLVAVRTGNYKVARDLFAKEVERAPSNHEFHFWLAVAYMGLGEVEQARKQLILAKETSTTRNDKEIYAAKLARLRSYNSN